MKVFEYKVEKREPLIISGKEYPDFRVVLYVDGEWINEWDGAWSERKATEIASLMKKQQTA